MPEATNVVTSDIELDSLDNLVQITHIYFIKMAPTAEHFSLSSSMKAVRCNHHNFCEYVSELDVLS